MSPAERVSPFPQKKDTKLHKNDKQSDHSRGNERQLERIENGPAETEGTGPFLIGKKG